MTTLTACRLDDVVRQTLPRLMPSGEDLRNLLLQNL